MPPGPTTPTAARRAEAEAEEDDDEGSSSESGASVDENSFNEKGVGRHSVQKIIFVPGTKILYPVQKTSKLIQVLCFVSLIDTFFLL